MLLCRTWTVCSIPTCQAPMVEACGSSCTSGSSLLPGTVQRSLPRSGNRVRRTASASDLYRHVSSTHQSHSFIFGLALSSQEWPRTPCGTCLTHSYCIGVDSPCFIGVQESAILIFVLLFVTPTEAEYNTLFTLSIMSCCLLRTAANCALFGISTDEAPGRLTDARQLPFAPTSSYHRYF